MLKQLNLSTTELQRRTVDLLERFTGIVIPTWFPPDTDLTFASDLLGSTVELFVREVADPSRICLSVDGPGISIEIAQQVATRCGTRLVTSEHNGGKLASVRNGAAALLAEEEVRYLAVIDHDGDHFANELLNFVRAAEHVAHNEASERVLVLGNRLSPHHALGFLRGEQEKLACWLLLDALHYHAAVTGKPLALHYATTIDATPDFHSGYKVFSRRSAEEVFLSEPKLAGCDGSAYFRHAVEAVMVVEALLAGAILATVNRRSYDEQPMSTFARMDRRQLAANTIIWPLKRLDVPGHFVAQWFTNHMPRLLLGTLAPQGQAELLAIRELVLEAFGVGFEPTLNKNVARAEFV